MNIFFHVIYYICVCTHQKNMLCVCYIVSINISYYTVNGIWWNQNKVNIDNVFAYNVELNVINDIDNVNQEQVYKEF